MTDVNGRRECLNRAEAAINGDRDRSYGGPEDSFTNIADIWNAQGMRIDAGDGITRYVQAVDVALFFAGMKLARLKVNPQHEDSWVDIAGYAACGMETSRGITAYALDAETRVKPRLESAPDVAKGNGDVATVLRIADNDRKPNPNVPMIGRPIRDDPQA